MKSAKESLISVVAFSPRDWSLNAKDAWLYGIICGWDKESLLELKTKFQWSDNETKRLQDLHVDFQSAK